MNKKKYNEEDYKIWISEYKCGMSVIEICRKYNISKTTVNNCLNDAKTNRRNSKFSNSDRTKWEIDYKGGMSTVSIADKYGLSHVTVHKHIKNIGLIRSVGGAKKRVVRIEIETGETKKYQSIIEASKDVKGRVSNICNCLNGRLMTAHGFKWEYDNNDNKGEKHE